MSLEFLISKIKKNNFLLIGRAGIDIYPDPPGTKTENAKMAMVPKDSISIIKGEENLSSYKFNTMIAEHFFCKICGIYTHHYRRSDPNGAGINIGCIDEIDPFEYKSDLVDMKNK